MASTIRIDGTLDIECAHWTTYVVGATYQPAAGGATHRTIGDLTDHVLARGGWWWAWGGGRYDALAIGEELRRRGIAYRGSLAGSSVTRIVAGRLRILDAMALIPLALERAAELAGQRAPRDLGWPCRCGDRCGGYCAITTRLPPSRYRELADYCARDARLAYEILAAVVTRWHALGLELRGTLGGTAWATARAWCGAPKATWEPRHWRQAARGYYGGRVVVARPAASIVDQYDLVSAYPAALRDTPLPIGEPCEVAGPRAAIAFGRDLPGIYHARIEVDHATYLPPLPVRSLDRRRTWYPVGRIRGWWALPEIQAAIRHGARLHRIEEGIVWPDGARPLLRDAVERWYGHRAADGKATAWGELWRLLANSLTGKLGQSPEHEILSVNAPDVRYCDPDSERVQRWGCTRDRCSRRCGAYRQLDRAGSVWAAPHWAIGESSHVQWAAYLTAHTRGRWLDAASAIGSDLVYGDTDSIWTTFRPPDGRGDALGQWAHKGQYGDFAARAPKVYSVVDLVDGTTIGRAAGMPALSDHEWLRLSGSDRARYHDTRGVRTLRESAPYGTLFSRRSRPLALPTPIGWYGDRELEDDGRTWPRTLKQIQHYEDWKARNAVK